LGERDALIAELATKKAEHAKMWQEAEDRSKEFDQMEKWKAQHCRHCPHCKRVVEKLDGCDSMKCGQNWHGGGTQNGCGKQFDWRSAPRYQPQAASHVTKPKDGTEETQTKLQALARSDYAAAQNMTWMVEEGRYLRCAMCRHKIQGPLFLCIDCYACVACFKCANGFGAASGGRHEPHSHVFAIKWKEEDLDVEDREILIKSNLVTCPRKGFDAIDDRKHLKTEWRSVSILDAADVVDKDRERLRGVDAIRRAMKFVADGL